MTEECTHECGSCGVSGCGERTAQGPATIAANARSNIRHVIGVVSGKGGVGKSLVTSLLASEMRKRGKRVGILDADVTARPYPRRSASRIRSRPMPTASCPPRRKAASRWCPRT